MHYFILFLCPLVLLLDDVNKTRIPEKRIIPTFDRQGSEM